VKHVVIDEGMRGSDIRPPALLAEMREMAQRDSAEFLLDAEVQESVCCPGCGGCESSGGYIKNSFHYLTCSGCDSVYVSPRPTSAALHAYYQDSGAARARRRYLAESEEKEGRSDVLWARARWICRLMDEAGPAGDRVLVDVYGRYPSLLTELEKLGCFKEIRSYRSEVKPVAKFTGSGEELPAGAAAVTMFEHLEHSHDPYARLSETAGMLVEGGMLFMTARSASGFDIQLLREHAPYIFPPEHLNLLSVEGVRTLLDRTGFDVVELSTPGQLDVEFVSEALEESPGIISDPFWRYFFGSRDEEAKQDLQYFLQKHRLSSHLRIAAQKRRSE
jgi:hypothetical protein